MNLARMLRRALRRVVSLKVEPRGTGGLKLSGDEIEDQLRIMSDREFAEYLRLHSKSHWWRA